MSTDTEAAEPSQPMRIPGSSLGSSAATPFSHSTYPASNVQHSSVPLLKPTGGTGNVCCVHAWTCLITFCILGKPSTFQCRGTQHTGDCVLLLQLAKRISLCAVCLLFSRICALQHELHCESYGICPRHNSLPKPMPKTRLALGAPRAPPSLRAGACGSQCAIARPWKFADSLYHAPELNR